MRSVHLDYETYSECDLKDAGVYRYAEHPSTEIIGCSYRFSDEDFTTLWIPYDEVLPYVLENIAKLRPDAKITTHAKCPPELFDHISLGGEIRAHNAQFERIITNGPGQKLGIPKMTIEQMVCTAVKVAASGIPRHLADAAKALGTPGKNDAGKIEMLQISKPKRPSKADPTTRYTIDKHPDKFVALYVYNIDDVAAEMGVDHAVPDLVPSERQIYQLDQRINDRGIRVDLPAVHDILMVVEEYKRFLAGQMREITADWMGDGLEPTQREKISEWIRSNGYPALVDMQAATVKALCESAAVPERIKRVLTIYSTYNSKAVSKLQAMIDAACSDGRLRGMFLMLGAGPGRWSSTIVQLQNLMRPVKELEKPEQAMECMEAFRTRDLSYVRMMYPDVDVMKLAGSLTRACLIADEGKDLIFVDFSQIETRVNAWLFGEQWKLDAFKALDDGTGPDLYKIAVSRSFGIPLEDVTKEQRQWGKVQELALGYEGGAAAFKTMVATYGIDLQAMTDAVLPLLTEEARSHGEWMVENHPTSDLTRDQMIACNGLKFLWRANHPLIKQGWKDLKHAAESAVEFEGQSFGIPSGKIWFKVMTYNGRKWLHMRLPSGRDIKYYNPRWIEPKRIVRPRKLENGYGGYTWVDEEVEVPGEFRYWGIDTDTRQWGEQSTYGGKLDENADQGYSSDLLRDGMLRLEAAGYTIIGTVHDECLCEVPRDFGSVDDAQRIMCAGAPVGLPLAADGKRQEFFWK